MDDSEHRPFVVERPGPNGRVKLGPQALEQLAEYQAAGYFSPGKKGREEFGKYLLQQHEAQQEEGTFSGGFSENIEDRREEEPQLDITNKRIWGAMPDVPPQAQTFRPNPLANALGFRDVGQRAPPAPQVLGPTAPQWPAAFGMERGGHVEDLSAQDTSLRDSIREQIGWPHLPEIKLRHLPWRPMPTFALGGSVTSVPGTPAYDATSPITEDAFFGGHRI